MKTDSFKDEFIAGFSGAVADIREKVVEEGWFERAVTTPSPETDFTPQNSANDVPTSLGAYIEQMDRNAPEPQEIEQNKDIDIDR